MISWVVMETHRDQMQGIPRSGLCVSYQMLTEELGVDPGAKPSDVTPGLSLTSSAMLGKSLKLCASLPSSVEWVRRTATLPL